MTIMIGSSFDRQRIIIFSQIFYSKMQQPKWVVAVCSAVWQHVEKKLIHFWNLLITEGNIRCMWFPKFGHVEENAGLMLVRNKNRQIWIWPTFGIFFSMSWHSLLSCLWQCFLGCWKKYQTQFQLSEFWGLVFFCNVWYFWT